MKMGIKKIVVLAGMIISLASAGCRSSEPRAMNSIVVGMPRRDVILLMGTPAKGRSEGNREILQFALHKSFDEPYAPDVPYWVFLEDGKVIKHGRGKDLEQEAALKNPQQAENMAGQIRFE